MLIIPLIALLVFTFLLPEAGPPPLLPWLFNEGRGMGAVF